MLCLLEREKTPCVQSPRGEGKTLCVQPPPEGGKTPCVQSPPEGEKTLLVQSQDTSNLVQFKSVFIQEKDLPVGGRLRQFLPEWEKHGSHRLITGLIRDGYKLPFREHPKLSRVPCIISSYAGFDKENGLWTSIQDLLQKGAVEVVHTPESLGFYSRLFLVPKPGNRWRPVRLEFTKQIPGHPKVQDGDPRVHACLPQERGMGHIYRSHRRLLTCANSHPVSKIPQVSFQRHHLPVHQAPLRAINSPPHFHQYSQRGKTDSFAIRNQTPPIPGRLVDPCPLRTTMHSSNTKTTKAGEGFGLYSKPQEVRTQTISEVRLPGLPLFTRFGSCEAHARQVDQTSDVPSPLLEVCYQCKDSYVHRHADQSCTKISITNMQDNSDSPRLANKTVVLGPGGNVSGHSKTTTTYTHSVKTTTEQPIPCQPNIHEPPHLVSRSSALQEHGFTAEVAEKNCCSSETLSTRSIYTSKWTIFQRWCTEKQVDFRSPSIGDICNFFWYLFNNLNRCPSAIEGYRTAIADTLGNTKQNISTNPEIARLIASFHRDKPMSSRSIHKWNLALVLQRLTQPPFEPQEEAALKFLTWKTVFLLALASGKRRSEIHAWTLDGLLCLDDWDQIQLSPSPSFIAKNQLAKEGPQSISPVVIPALKCSQDSPDTDVILCLLRGLQCYLDRTKDSIGGRQLLFISYKLGHSKDIQCSTISSLIKNTIKFCYTKVAFAASKAFYGGISMDQIMQA